MKWYMACSKVRRLTGGSTPNASQHSRITFLRAATAMGLPTDGRGAAHTVCWQRGRGWVAAGAVQQQQQRAAQRRACPRPPTLALPQRSMHDLKPTCAPHQHHHHPTITQWMHHPLGWHHHVDAPGHLLGVGPHARDARVVNVLDGVAGARVLGQQGAAHRQWQWQWRRQ